MGGYGRLLLENNLKQNQKDVQSLRRQINDLEQYGRREMLEINEVPYRKQEETDQIVINIAQALKVELTKEDIQVFHRLSPDANSGVIVKFTSRRKKEEMFNQRKHPMKITMESLGFTDAQIPDKHIVINESLTATNRYILKYADYKLKKNSNFKFI